MKTQTKVIIGLVGLAVIAAIVIKTKKDKDKKNVILNATGKKGGQGRCGYGETEKRQDGYSYCVNRDGDVLPNTLKNL